MATRNEYNGWFNYETWLVKLWMDNDEGAYRMWQGIAKEVNDEYPKRDNAVGQLSKRLQAEHEEAAPETTGLWADLMNAALAEVNWFEIAEHLIDEVREEE
jgi:hypothetical protein